MHSVCFMLCQCGSRDLCGRSTFGDSLLWLRYEEILQTGLLKLQFYEKAKIDAAIFMIMPLHTGSFLLTVYHLKLWLLKSSVGPETLFLKNCCFLCFNDIVHNSLFLLYVLNPNLPEWDKRMDGYRTVQLNLVSKVRFCQL